MAAAKGNKYAVGANSGRPAKYKTPKALSNACEEYFVYIEGDYHFETARVKNEETGDWEDKKIKVWDRYPEPSTVTGLALFLGFENRQSLIDYAGKEEFSCIIKRAKGRVEHEYEKALWRDKPTGAIFALKNMGWNDKIDLTTDGKSMNNGFLGLMKEASVKEK